MSGSSEQRISAQNWMGPAERASTSVSVVRSRRSILFCRGTSLRSYSRMIPEANADRVQTVGTEKLAVGADTALGTSASVTNEASQ